MLLKSVGGPLHSNVAAKTNKQAAGSRTRTGLRRPPPETAACPVQTQGRDGPPPAPGGARRVSRRREGRARGAADAAPPGPGSGRSRPPEAAGAREPDDARPRLYGQCRGAGRPPPRRGPPRAASGRGAAAPSSASAGSGAGRRAEGTPDWRGGEPRRGGGRRRGGRGALAGRGGGEGRGARRRPPAALASGRGPPSPALSDTPTSARRVPGAPSGVGVSPAPPHPLAGGVPIDWVPGPGQAGLRVSWTRSCPPLLNRVPGRGKAGVPPRSRAGDRPDPDCGDPLRRGRNLNLCKRGFPLETNKPHERGRGSNWESGRAEAPASSRGGRGESGSRRLPCAPLAPLGPPRPSPLVGPLGVVLMSHAGRPIGRSCAAPPGAAQTARADWVVWFVFGPFCKQPD